MQYNKIGNTDMIASAVGLGGMSLTGGATKTNVEIVQRAFDGGITYFDTADLYEKGLNETLFGQALSGFRQRVVLATKVGNKWRPDGEGWDWKPSKAHILKEVEASLTRLKTDYIDLYQLHGGTIDDPFEEIIEAFELLIKQGKIRSYGFSSIRPNVFERYAKYASIVSNMMPYSLLDRRPEPYFKQLENAGIDVAVRGALAQGLLINKQAKEYLQQTAGEVSLAQRQINRLSEELGQSATTIALRYAITPSAVKRLVIGVRAMKQLDDVLDSATKLQPLDVESLALLENGLRKGAYTEHLS
ncbi:aldo/keto reductase [Sphingobacterium sp. lm-10]|uniref:aldo/keto reductase n=1 Tax=Sphingobacterium sp. lm-10 TaxID=2944904 RepID=UPI002020627F|nr:aldo/keto reductase [Sphingobacterium sp. lm-10]MCL7986975.1 aldo/keto reductase [Sphingobacterium sp. lm-10]